MCLVVFGWRYAPGRRLALVGNRDEFHARPTAPMGWWGEPPLLAGRDLSAGGTWLGVDARARFGVITNFRGGRVPPHAPSRGTLIPRYLAGDLAPLRFLEALAREGSAYAGFSLLLGDAESLGYYCNQDATSPRLLGPGVYGLSNATLDAPWPKLIAAREALRARLDGDIREPEELGGLLASRALAADAALPDTGVGLELERRLSAAFIDGADYGTRSTTALVLDAAGRGGIVEDSFGANGRPAASRRFELGPPDA